MILRMFGFALPEVKKKKVVFILGATATGKSKLSVDLATHFVGEVINSDKIQVYKGLDIITNKITPEESRGVPHHLMAFVDPDLDYTKQEFCQHTMDAVAHIIDNGHVPIIVGGSNSYIEALVENPELDFKGKYDYCFLWMDVSLPVLYDYVGKRVDQMVDAGLVEEVREMFVPGADYTRGVRRAIGAPEMEKYFMQENYLNETEKAKLLETCIQEIKDNTIKLVHSQLDKINRLQNELGWKLHRIDATTVLERTGRAREVAWEKTVLKPTLVVVKNFLKI